MAEGKHIRLVNTGLSGRPVDDIQVDFVFNKEGTKVLRCPAGYEPKSCGYTGGFFKVQWSEIIIRRYPSSAKKDMEIIVTILF